MGYDPRTAFPGTKHIAYVNSTLTTNQAIEKPKRYAR